MLYKSNSNFYNLIKKQYYTIFKQKIRQFYVSSKK